jgi:glycosyltransferase involved in cell wall biosynthesis
MTTDLPINSSERASAVKAMTVSVIVPTFNRAHCIGECLESLLVQTVPPLEIVVIDDGSEDGTADVLARYGDRIRYVRKENGGKPRAVNLGLSLAQGALIWIFDDDDVALPDAIERRLEVLEAKPGIGFVYGQHFIGTNGPGWSHCPGSSLLAAVPKGRGILLRNHAQLLLSSGDCAGATRTAGGAGWP